MVPVVEGKDPLGLMGRVSNRLANQLLFCITSITPRARYYSFLPWCIEDYRQRVTPPDIDISCFFARDGLHAQERSPEKVAPSVAHCQ
jgi:hypothetical protein